ncbi:MAG: ABC transporter ATP-binding protein [Planctomycetota bacterium]
MSDNAPLLECKSLSRTFVSGDTELHVLKEVDFQLAEGDVCAVFGASGAGKSTMLHLLGLLDTPTKGQIFYRGQEITNLSEDASAKIRNREFGFVFQSFHLLPEFTALENVLMPLRIGSGALGWMNNAKKFEKRAKDLLSEMGLGERLNHIPGRLSGGERQRVALARALINEPAVVFCDEPTGNLDSKRAEEMFELIHKYNTENNQTFLIVSHDEHLARHCKRRVNMADGKIVPTEAPQP